MFFAFLVKKTYFLAQAFANLHGKRRQGLRKLGPKNNIPEVFLTRKAKKKISIYINYVNANTV